MTKIIKSNLDFLKELGNNNNRDWFLENKDLYEKNREGVISFADDLLKKVNEHDNIETVSGKKSIFRIFKKE